MELNRTSLEALFTGYKANFQAGFSGLGDVGNQYQQIVTEVPSRAAQEVYPWLTQIPRMREWLGDRVIHGIGSASFTITNRKFEATVAVNRDSLDDDSYGLYSPMMTELGRTSAEHPNLLVVELLESNPLCYDGQNLFDTDHPVTDSTGSTVSKSNDLSGASPAWYVMDLSRAIRPVILQRRRDYQFRSITDLNAERVFLRDEYLYGVDARLNAGAGLWQLIVRSKATFNATSYAAARLALTGLAGDEGRQLGLRHTHTMVPTNLEGAARKVLQNQQASGGETNEWAGTSQLLINPWLSQS